ncbi:hypothetical protein K0M31_001906 [Melipona bicolor]|uniref:Uncharacterized protein n=1 Tax=Melipona bicolor TaxID=60889 RepID=A0AA40GHL5_9HYME|nr:hypothetical protein K0M31_001906 [Melipona bicolor]
MGCELSKLATPNQPTTDPRLPLTAKQKFTVMASWKAVSRKLETTGVVMLLRIITIKDVTHTEKQIRQTHGFVQLIRF